MIERAIVILGLVLIGSAMPAQNACNVEGTVIQSFSYGYNPSEITIEPGTTLVWINIGGNHDAQGETNSITDQPYNNPEGFDFPNVSTPTGVAACIGWHTFTEPGVYTYDCSVGNHAQNGMVAQFTVAVSGCTDSAACNYDADATEDDGSCLFPGCIFENADNYNPNAFCDDGSCIFSGCTDNLACNFDNQANTSDDSCTYPGCDDADAANYDPNAGCSDGSCLYALDECQADMDNNLLINTNDLIMFLALFGTSCD